jgi:hypothetical protein
MRGRAHFPRQAGRPVRVRATAAGLELSRQVPVDLEPDADLNEGRGCPGHWSSSLAFSSCYTLDRGTPPRKPPQPHGRKHTRSLLSREFYRRQPLGLPVTYQAAYHCAGKAHSMPGGSGHLVKSMHLASEGVFLSH